MKIENSLLMCIINKTNRYMKATKTLLVFPTEPGNHF